MTTYQSLERRKFYKNKTNTQRLNGSKEIVRVDVFVILSERSR